VTAGRRNIILLLVFAVVLVAAAGAVVWLRQPSIPQAGSAAHTQVVTAFYRGLAALEVGLLDDARDQFARATELAPTEPAAWANLALAQLRRGDIESAAPAVERALDLAPNRADVLLLAARLESARGGIDQSVAFLRRATAADPADIRARFALVDELERAGQDDASAEVLELLDDLVARAPMNLAVIVERGRAAARRGDGARASDSVARLQGASAGWPEIALEQLAGLQQAVASARWTDATRSAALLRNVLARVPAFGESLAAVRTPAELIGAPFARFVVWPSPVAQPAAPDTGLAYRVEPLGTAPANLVVAMYAGEATTPSVLGVSLDGLRRVDASGAPVAAWGPDAADRGVTLADWNHDFRPDVVLAGSAGVRLLLQQADGRFADGTPPGGVQWGAGGGLAAVWAADIEMDGDLDLVAGVQSGATTVLRNNGDGTWRTLAPFPSVNDARAFAWADLDGDADPDAAFLDGQGTLHVLLNRQAGAFTPDVPAAGITPAVALTIADLDADGRFEIVLLARDGTLSGLTRGAGGWTARTLASWTAMPPGAGQPARVFAADLDNNGAIDLLASAENESQIWLGDGVQFQPLSTPIAGRVHGVADLTGEGTLDLYGTVGLQPARWVGNGPRGYRSKSIRVRAQQNAGDQRINSFGLGGDIEVRAGLLWQKQPITDAVLHFGLGTAAGIDVARVVWPNGVPQAEFDVAAAGPLVAEQRLKGSCPWVFAHDGRSVQFVTDFLWRSPLGLRINAQDTAGVVQTEDWVRIRGDQLAPVDGAYDLRITAELWETHFFDHVSLLVVDHPSDAEVFVDERFSASAPPALAVQAVRGIAPVVRASDDRGQDVTALVVARDGRFLASFPKGAYQGIAREHFVEVEVPAGSVGDGRVLVAQGWVYPTDSSINMAIGQGTAVRPSGLVLEALVDGAWRVVEPDLGFPAGKNKTMVIDLATPLAATRFRLRTNLEIYWDWLAVGSRVAAPWPTTRLQPSAADLVYRGFSTTSSPRGDAPETPAYAPVANVAQRWRDLEGYYTRFGDVRELLAGVDDRYVIMNAGDELRLRFPAQAAPRAGWRRDFVLIGDGWEKDGDYNTGHSQTVLPLPDHARPDYGADGAPRDLESDPVYKRHSADWSTFHTRYVTPAAFLQGMRPGIDAAR